LRFEHILNKILKPGLKISIVTVVRNAENTIARCLNSVISQNYANLEYIVIDGASTDNTVNIINKFASRINVFISEPDKGIYDAMNKGIALATGDVVGILNADDVFADDTVLTDVACFFVTHNLSILYGNLNYVDKRGKIARNWGAGEYKYGAFNRGWMPPHPTFYCRRELFNTYGNYSLAYGTAADYELMSRYLHLNKLPAGYLNKTMVKMNTGGASNVTYLSRIKSMYNDFKAMRKNGVQTPLLAIVLKPLRKVVQYLN
jgi:glycosyltransferase involved in cell wall biosynthesis